MNLAFRKPDGNIDIPKSIIIPLVSLLVSSAIAYGIIKTKMVYTDSRLAKIEEKCEKDHDEIIGVKAELSNMNKTLNRIERKLFEQ